jgi:GAF domain-containing protein
VKRRREDGPGRGAATDGEGLVRKLMFSMSTLEDLGNVFSSGDDFPGTLRTALSSIMGALPVSRGGLFLYRRREDGGRALELTAAVGIESAPGLSLPLPGEAVAEFLATGAVLSRDALPPGVARYLAGFRMVFDGIKTMIILPLRYRGEFLGLVCLGPKFDGSAFGEHDNELLGIVSGYTAVAIHNRKLMADLRNANEGLREKIGENTRLYDNLRESYRDIVRALGAAIDAKDPYTSGHSGRVARLTTAIARAMGLAEDEVEGIGLASHLHDIGKIAIDNSILGKPTRLSRSEFDAITRHPVVSYDILSNIRFPYGDIALLTRHHHERLNGQGYPDGKSSAELTTGMRILSLADAFDAMTSDRPYRPAMSVESALEEITRHVSVQFDRSATEALLMTLREEIQGKKADEGILEVVGKGNELPELGPVIERLLTEIGGVTAH